MSKGGGGKESPTDQSSHATTTTTQIDRRQVVDNGGIGIAGESAVINVLDAGAIDKPFAFANANDQELTKNLDNQLGFARNIFESGLSVLDKAGQQVQLQTQLVAKAYDNAQGDGTAKTVLTVAAIASVALVAVKVWGK
jgi:hypothetical protein